VVPTKLKESDSQKKQNIFSQYTVHRFTSDFHSFNIPWIVILIMILKNVLFDPNILPGIYICEKRTNLLNI